VDPFTRLVGVAAPLPRDNVDTDAVIPVPWMKSVTPDYARALFANWRWQGGDGVTQLDEFVLNREPFRSARILVAGANFGCGSSREAAVWALLGFGIRCVIAPSFGDIFYENSFKNALLPLVLPEDEVKSMLDVLASGAGGCRMEVNLEAQSVTRSDGKVVPFAIDAGRRAALLSGLDEIGVTLRDRDAIDAFQRHDRVERPWIYDPPLNADVPMNRGET
jgi:3-isopropylmalate/(R)-2-methylmalate dehydratase small subunit